MCFSTRASPAIKPTITPHPMTHKHVRIGLHTAYRYNQIVTRNMSGQSISSCSTMFFCVFAKTLMETVDFLRWDSFFNNFLVQHTRCSHAQKQHTRTVVHKRNTQAATGVELACDWNIVPEVDTHCSHMLYLSQTRSSAACAV